MKKATTYSSSLKHAANIFFIGRSGSSPTASACSSITRDGSLGYKGHAGRIADILKESGIVPQRIFANGCTYLIYKAASELAQFNVPVMVSLNPIMIDGTGMCGVCRVTVDGRMKFACVDGPDFDGRLVDWQELSKRRKQYIGEEAFLVHNASCGRIEL